MRNELADRALEGPREGRRDGLDAELVREIAYGLHELCQPLTALQCRLELARIMGDASLLLETVEDSLTETRRMFAAVSRMREGLIRGETLEQGGERDERSGSDGF